MNSQRPSNLILWVALVVQLVCGTPQATEAVPITFQTSGTVVSVDPALAGTFSAGNTLSLLYTFESTTPPRAGSTAFSAVFDALKSLSFSISGYGASSTGAREIQTDVSPSGINDRYTLVSRASEGLTGAPVGGNALTEFRMLLDHSPGTVFSNAQNLPTDSQSLNTFEDKNFFIVFGSPQVSGNLTDFRLVPAPGSLLLLGSGLVGLMALYWRRQRRR